METRRIFRKLVTNQFSCLEDFGYFGQRFAFRTVFSKTSYSYCCCSCSFEHEYLGYLSDSGCINEHLYEKIVKSIVNGQCPHVVKVSIYMYLFDSGCINEQLYEKIVKSIVNGLCPHVVKVSIYMYLSDSGCINEQLYRVSKKKVYSSITLLL